MSDAAPPSTGASAAASESSAPVVVTLEARDDDAGAVAALEAELAAEREVSMRLRADKLVLETNLRDAFDYGQVYVALSRAVSIEGLRVMGFDPEKVRVHPKVQHFYARQGGKGGKGTLQGLWEDRENTTRQNLHQPGARGEDGGYREPSRVSQPPPTFASSQRPGVSSTSSCYRCDRCDL